MEFVMAMIDESTNSARMQSRHLITVLSRKKEKGGKNDKYGGCFLRQTSLYKTQLATITTYIPDMLGILQFCRPNFVPDVNS